MLASGSPRRRELLARLGIDPIVRPADVDETVRTGERAADLVLRLAHAKATASATDDEVVLAADTVVVLGQDVLGKPRDADDAGTMLRRLSGRTHLVMTGLAVRAGEHDHLDVVTTQVTFRDLTEAEIGWYLATGEPDDKAGAYALQGAGAVLVERIAGSDTNVIGLPLAETVALLRRAGWDALSSMGAPGRPTPRR